MARAKTGLIKDGYQSGNPKKTRQGNGKHSKRTAKCSPKSLLRAPICCLFLACLRAEII